MGLHRRLAREWTKIIWFPRLGSTSICERCPPRKEFCKPLFYREAILIRRRLIISCGSISFIAFPLNCLQNTQYKATLTFTLKYLFQTFVIGSLKFDNKFYKYDERLWYVGITKLRKILKWLFLKEDFLNSGLKSQSALRLIKRAQPRLKKCRHLSQTLRICISNNRRSSRSVNRCLRLRNKT